MLAESSFILIEGQEYSDWDYLKNYRVPGGEACPNNPGFLSQLRDLEFGIVVDQA